MASSVRVDIFDGGLVNRRLFQAHNGAKIKLYFQDCLKGMQEHLEPGSVDVVVTSPPYNLGIKYDGYDDSQSRRDYLLWMDKWFVEIERVLADDGSFFLNVGSKPTDPMVPFQLLAIALEHFELQNTIHWVKSIAIMKDEIGDYPGITNDVVVGHYKPINSERFLNDCHEYIFHLTKHSSVYLDRMAVGVPYQDKTNIGRWAKGNGGKHCRGNTWFLPYETIKNRSKDRPHPATFPVELPKRCINLHGVERTKLVLDPFLGIGSSSLACTRMGVPFVGFEIAEDYYKESCYRTSKLIAEQNAKRTKE